MLSITSGHTCTLFLVLNVFCKSKYPLRFLAESWFWGALSACLDWSCGNTRGFFRPFFGFFYLSAFHCGTFTIILISAGINSFGTAGFLISFFLATIFAVLLLMFLTRIFPVFSFKSVVKKSNSPATLPMTPIGNQIKTARITQETPIMNDARSTCSLSVNNCHKYLSAVSSNSHPRPPNIIISEEEMKRELVLWQKFFKNIYEKTSMKYK